ncbi:hypothetical protein C8J56DRAFT_784257 [Mycena floridula]|nr:hypothetical protein C8J56DRAFT_784257 [Mycena floridula]
MEDITVDDSLGDPITSAQITYEPSDAWNYGPSCTRCSTKPDNLSDIRNGTWHDVLSPIGQNVTATFQFSVTGTAISVYGIKIQTAYVTLLFLIDGQQFGSTFLAIQPDEILFTYNYLYFSKGDLTSGQHTLVIQNGNQTQNSLFLLDYIKYTRVDNVGVFRDPDHVIAGLSSELLNSRTRVRPRREPIT